MDDYHDVDAHRLKVLEKLILSAGLRLPDIWGTFAPRDAEHNTRILRRLWQAAYGRSSYKANGQR